MRRTTSFLAVLALLLVGLATQLTPRVAAQDATPSSAPQDTPGVTFTPLGFAPDVTIPANADLIMIDLEMAAGTTSPFDPNDPSGGMIYVESGEFTIRVDGAIWGVNRGKTLEKALAAGSTDDANFYEVIQPGQETTLTEGDVAWVPGGVSGEIRNDSDDDAEGTLFLIAPAGTLSGGPAGTPAP